MSIDPFPETGKGTDVVGDRGYDDGVSFSTPEQSQVQQQCENQEVCQSSTPPNHIAQHGQVEQGPADQRDQQDGRAASSFLGEIRTCTSSTRVVRGAGQDRAEGEAHTSTRASDPAEQTQDQEERDGGVPREQLAPDDHGERDHGSAGSEGPRPPLQDCGGDIRGPGGLRQACREDLRRSPVPMPPVCQLGATDSGRDRRDEPQDATLGGMAEEGDRHHNAGEASDVPQAAHQDRQGLHRGARFRRGAQQLCGFIRRDCECAGAEGHRHGQGDPRGDEGLGRSSATAPAGGERDEGREAPQDMHEVSREGPSSYEDCMIERPECGAQAKAPDLGGTLSHDLSLTEARRLEEESQAVVPRLYQSLIAHSETGRERPILMEVACEPHSLLSRTVQDRTGNPESAVRASLFNSGDLSSSAGLRLVLDRIRLERPQHVWISPPCGPFSPLQNTNQRTEQQRAELAEKRRHAMKVFTGAVCIVHLCMQLGIHCSWQWPERSDAWRLPMIQRLIQKYDLYLGVTKGCRVQLRDEKNARLMAKGWKIMTSLSRLAEEMNLPCKCGKHYVHGRCEGRAAAASASYTPEYARRVASVLCQELSYQATLQECTGGSQLPTQFGLGETCVCGETKLQDFQLTCGNCLMSGHDLAGVSLEATNEQSSEDGSRAPQPEVTKVNGDTQVTQSSSGFQAVEIEKGEVLWSQEKNQDLENKARQLLQAQDYSLKTAEGFLREVAQLTVKRSRQKVPGKHAEYVLFGMYSHGNQYGITKRTEQMPHTSAYLNKFFKKYADPEASWSSLVVSRNNQMPIHRDSHNDPNYPNRLLGVGDYHGGELWVETPPGYQGEDALAQERSDGTWTPGRKLETRGRVVTFSPQAWHGTMPWTGECIVVTAYVSRGAGVVDSEFRKGLRDFGFPCPRYPDVPKEEGFALQRLGKWQRRLGQAPKQEDERIRKQLYLLHSATGHSSTRHMIESLKRRGASERVLQLAREFQCAVCMEKRKVGTRNLSTLEPLPPRWSTVAADIGHWTHPHTHETVQFMLLIDEASRFRVARILTTGSRQQPGALKCLEYLQEGWIQYFGRPKTLRLDPAGSFRSQSVEAFCDRHHIYLEVIPGEAHWKLGVCEQAIQGVKQVMTKMCEVEASVTPAEALATAIRTFNHREILRGFSPVQHALGHATDEVGHALDVMAQVPVESLWEDPVGEVARAAQCRAEAEKAHSEWVAQQRIVRASNSRSHPVLDFQPGELVFFWRAQTGQQSRRQPGDRHGRFLGPARVLATEKGRDTNGQLRPASSIWLVRGRSLIKCCPEQLRRASEREELLEGVAEGDDRTPWTFRRVAQEIGGNQFKDYTAEQPTAQEWERAQDVEMEHPPLRRRLRGKRTSDDMEPTEDQVLGHTPATASRARGRHQQSEPSQGFPQAAAWWTEVKEDLWQPSPAAYWTDEEAAMGVEIPMPESQRAWQAFHRDAQGYFVGALKRRAVEVSERRLSEKDKQAFREAKAIEVRNFLAAKAFESLPEERRPSADQAINMRWILTWKVREDGSTKAKARAVLLGYQDPLYEHRATTAPVMTRQTRQMQLQLSSIHKWQVQKGDVSGAFLQGREYPGELLCIPCPEICQAMQIPEGSVTRLKRACYGLVDAPLEWYRTVADYFQELGLTRTWSDACCWVWRPNGQLRGVITGHVDDFMFSGRASDKEWQAILEKIRQKFQVGRLGIG